MVAKQHCSIFFLLLLWGAPLLWSQTSEQKALEEKREQLQNEIREINRLLLSEKRERGTVLDQMEALDKKITVRQQLIRVTNQQANLLNRQINTNIRNISKLKGELQEIKEEYARMIQKSYQNKSKQNRLMFLLSSESFYQAFKRLQYMKQYTDYRKEQGAQILAKTEELTRLNIDLNEERKVKEVLLAQNTKAKDQLFAEIQEQKNYWEPSDRTKANMPRRLMRKKGRPAK
ncbi:MULTISPECIES: hypothetical protein [Maribacter]|uniref:Peptidase M23 n=1 Tax=Maribacter flavus TaxID=1658664 RepID=A0ABU7IEC0_9FLAO|nr:hypothetical protein [Maribacter flavus]MEE1971282.1 hypothetical protein [Maribacter flavus]